MYDMHSGIIIFLTRQELEFGANLFKRTWMVLSVEYR